MKLKLLGVTLAASFLMMVSALTVYASEASAPELTAASNTTASGTAINVTNFPDDVFREYVTTNFDTEEGTEGYLSEAEIAAVSTIDVNNTTVADLSGIDFFTNLTILNCSKTNITTLNTSNNPKLGYLYCQQTAISSLDLSNNLELRGLTCYTTNITSLDVSNNTKLERLNCENTPISNLDISNNPNLVDLRCFVANMEHLDISENTALTRVLLYIGDIGCTYDFSNIAGFDSSKAYNWTGATYKDGKLLDFTAYNFNVNCSYDFDNAASFTFYGQYKNTHNYVDGVCTGCGKSNINPVEISGNYAILPFENATDTSDIHLLTYEIYDAAGNVAGILEFRYGINTILQYWITQNGVEKTISSSYFSQRNNQLRISLNMWKSYFPDESYSSLLTNDVILTEKPDAPTSLIWDTSAKPGVATWNKVIGYTRYYTQLMYEGKTVGGIGGETDRHDMSLNINESGTYTYQVKTIGGKTTGDSDFCEAITYEYIRPEKEIGAPAKVWWSTKAGESEPIIINWEPVAGAAGYRLSFNNFTSTMVYNSNNKLVTSYDCTDVMNYLEERLGEISTFTCTVTAIPGNIEVVANTEGNSASSDTFVSIEKIEEEINNKLEDTTADTVIKDIKDTGVDKMADAMQNNKEILDKVANIEKDYAENNNINVLPPEVNHPEFKQDDIKVVGAGLNAKPDSEIKLDFTELDKENEKPVNEKLYKNPVQVDIKLKDKDENVKGKLQAPITITMKAPSGLNLDKLVILHHLEDGNIEQIRPIINADDTITFSVTSFSTFVFADLVYYDESGSENLPEVDAPDDNTPEVDDPDDNTPEIDTPDDNAPETDTPAVDSSDDDNYYVNEDESNRNRIENYYWNGTAGWKKVANDWYYFDSTGSLKTGWVQDTDGKWYFMNNNGKMATGWVCSPASGLWYYMGTTNGDMLSNGWFCDPESNRWYYLDSNGAMCTSWITVDGIWYLLDDNGAMCTGWNLVDGNWYYMNQSGAMLTGWQTINDKEYYLDEVGKCLINTTTPDGHKFDETGAKIE